MNGFIDTDCKIELDGKTFESGGAWIAERADNHKLSGLVYADDIKGVVTNWHGDKVIKATFGRVFRSNFGDRRRSVYFHYAGKCLFGIWHSIDFNQAVNVREINA